MPGELKIRLLQLQGELTTKSLQEAVAHSSKYRPLCDEHGYPLVGNMVRKAGFDEPKNTTDVSEFCAHLRTKKHP